MNYQALNINEFNEINQSRRNEEKNMETIYSNMDAYLQRGRAARSAAVYETFNALGRSIRGIFA